MEEIPRESCTLCGELFIGADAVLIPKDLDDRRAYHEECGPEGWAASGEFYLVED